MRCEITPTIFIFFNGGLLTYSSVSQIFEFGFGTHVRSLPNELLITTPKKSLPGAGGGFLKISLRKKDPFPVDYIIVVHKNQSRHIV